MSLNIFADPLLDPDYSMMSTEHSGMGTTPAGNTTRLGKSKMYFHIGLYDIVLLYDWVPKSDGAVFGYCAAFFFMSLIYEALKYYRESLLRKKNKTPKCDKMEAQNGNGDVHGATSHKKNWKKSMFSGSHFLQSGLHLIQVTLSYILMLVVMTYNVWMCLAVVLGCTVGFYLFGWKSSSKKEESAEHCH